MNDSLEPIPDAFQIRDGLPRPDWSVVAAWMEANTDFDFNTPTWTEFAHDWLVRLSDALPGSYRVYQSEEFLLLAADDAVAKRVLKLAERARRTILQNLTGVARETVLGKNVILLFADVDSYYDYVTDFYPEEGDFGLSSGIFLDGGYAHFAICPAYDPSFERVIAHEMNHALLSHLPLPLWLNEGVTQVMEDMVVESSYFMVDREILARHRAYWDADTIQLFWSGESFLLPDEGQELSYHLAQVLFRNLMSDHPKQVKAILNQANFADAGNAAFVNAINTPLAQRAAQFLGDGPWTPGSDYARPDEAI